MSSGRLAIAQLEKAGPSLLAATTNRLREEGQVQQAEGFPFGQDGSGVSSQKSVCYENWDNGGQKP